MYQHFDIFWQSTTVHAPGSNIIAPSYGYEVAEHTLTGKHNRGKSWKQTGPSSICALPILLHLTTSWYTKRLRSRPDVSQIQPSGQDKQYTSSTLQAPQAPQQSGVAIFQTPQAWKSTGSKAQPRFISLNSLTSGKSNINDQIYVIFMFYIVLYVCFETWVHMFSHAPFPHHSMDLYIRIYNIHMDLLVSYGLLSPLKLSRNALPSICSVNLVLSSHDFKQIHGDFMWFLCISDVFLPCHTLPLESFRCL